MNYRIEYHVDPSRGCRVCGGRRSEYDKRRAIVAETDAEAAKEATRFIREHNEDDLGDRLRFRKLVRVDQPEVITEISVKW